MVRVQKKKRKGRIVLWRFIQRNDVVLRIYTSFAFVLALTGVLIGLIFMSLYQKNYIRSYTKLLTRQGKSSPDIRSIFLKGRNRQDLKNIVPI